MGVIEDGSTVYQVWIGIRPRALSEHSAHSDLERRQPRGIGSGPKSKSLTFTGGQVIPALVANTSACLGDDRTVVSTCFIEVVIF